jgi:lipoprotein NlpD
VAETPKVLPGAENAGKPGYYTVKPGDTVIRIGLESGQNWRDIVKWNALENQNLIEVGQVLRVVPPGVDPSQAGVRPVAPARVETRPLEPRPAATAAAAGTASPASVVPSTAASAGAAAASSGAAPAPAKDPDVDINWAWPSGGAVVAGFDDARSNKGLSIAGKAGDPVLASAEGRVVYAGSGLRGYGNLIILQHNGGYLTAYAHNQTLLVKEDQAVRRGQKIAEMGATDSDRVQLHFEIRKQGKPVDPARLLPPR